MGDERGLQLDVREPAAGAGHSLGSVVPYKKTKKNLLLAGVWITLDQVDSEFHSLVSNKCVTISIICLASQRKNLIIHTASSIN